jgi:iron complex outermembrane receptor protein
MSLPHPRLTRRTRALTWLAAALIALPGFGVPHAASADEADAPEEPAVRRVGVEEIVVTARKREERLQDTPVSVTALTADKIDSYQLTDLSQISLLTPNLSFDSSAPLTGSSSSSSIYIRGIGSSEFSLATEPGVGMYVDGVYLARSIGGVLDLVDPARIEVLRGPQGTLFGRNTIGGAIHIVSKRPEPELGGSARITLGSDSLSRWEGMLNVPVNETVRMRGSFMRTKQGGYVSDRTGTISDAGDKDSWAARTTLEWLPTDQVAVTLRADVTRERQGPAPNVLVALNPDGPPDTNTGMPTRSFVGGLIDLTCVGLGVPGPGFAGCQSAVLGGLQQQLLNGPFATAGGFVTGRPEVNAAASQPLSPKTELDIWGTSATVDWELTSELSVRAISSYRRLDTFFNLDIDHSGLPILQDVNDFDSDQTAHELQLNGQAMEGRLTYTVGGYYFLENGDNKDVVEFLPGALLSGGKFRNQGTAGFGQMTYSVTERLQVTLGARYSYEKKVFDTARQRVLVDFVAPGPDGMLAPIPDPAFMAGADLVTAENKSTNRDRALTPHLSVAYFFADDVMTYVSYSEGFKAGGFQQRIFPARPFASSFDKETAQVYELGVKATLLDSTMSVAAATFFTKYDDLQIAVAEGIAPILTNAGEAQIKGYEVEMQYRPLPELGIDVVLGFTDAQYAQIDPSRTGVGRGNKLVNTPRWSAGAGVSYRADLGPRLGAATAQVSWSFRDDVENDAFNTPELSEDQVNTYDAALTWESPSTNWRVTLAGRNLTDRTYIVSGSNVPLAGVVEAAYARGRTWQVSVERSF